MLSAWTRSSSTVGAPAGGRFYLGFGASAAGASSFVVAFNTQELLFQNNSAFGFQNLNTASFTFSPDKWYRAEVLFGASSITGNLYDSDGTTLLASLVASGLTNANNNGIAVRAFNGAAFDDISLSRRIGAVPEPASWAMLIMGFGLAGAAQRRRRQIAA
ncbi:PEPxxWA-CTERM sorting domain-containing protein [Sandarakinorhabdus rubra]|uniref:PEPxxWA-CTERM sorting domain-containing protein n=1 Tax=Sandarakinorhabdus rubra TaxID=2672568 RepID=UPI001F39CAA5|nr:PEPxxWA-CTERM sorting domain-containing protein [Sandarakinorhabdus rubra]